MLWQRLVKHFAAQAKAGGAYSVSGIMLWDLNARFLTSRHLTPHVLIAPDDLFSNLVVSVNYSLSARFLQRKKNITAFRINMIFLFPDFNNNKIVTIPVGCPINY
jgi:hypothetical protein